LEWVERFSKFSRENQKNFIQYCLHFFRELMISQYSVHHSSRLTNNEAAIATQMEGLERAELEKIVGFLDKAHYYIERNVHIKVLMMNLSIQLTSVFKTLAKKQVS
jgi:DNA polymerase-3 subunit delta'